MPHWNAWIWLALVWTLAPLLAFGFAGETIAACIRRWPRVLRLIIPAMMGLPYVVIAVASGSLHLGWTALYLLFPMAVAILLERAARIDPEQQGTVFDFVLLLFIGLAVDLRWFEPAWPRGLTFAGKIILLDAGLYGFLAIRRLSNVGYDLRLRRRDIAIGLRELALYTPIAVALGLAIGFLHLHWRFPTPLHFAAGWLFTFFFIAIPEEVFFRGWLQNLLQRRLGGNAALLLTSVLFGLSHFNKRAVHFNGRYVLLATLAGIFYGRAWRDRHRVAASSITHASVDTIWSIWLR